MSAATPGSTRGLARILSWWPVQLLLLFVALAAIDLYDEAIRLDPNYARAIAFRSGALVDYAVSFATGPALGKDFLARGESDARHAIALAPRLADGHVALAWYHRQALQLTLADQEYRDALALAPGNAEVLLGYGQYAIRMGRTEEGLATIRRAVELDPVNERARLKLGSALWSVRRYREAATELDAVLSLNPHDNTALAHRGFTSYITGELEAARASCESGSRKALLEAVAVHHVPERPRRPRLVIADTGIDQDIVVRRLYDEALHAQDQPAADRIDECRLQPRAVLLKELFGERREKFHHVKERPLLLDHRVNRDVPERDCSRHLGAFLGL